MHTTQLFTLLSKILYLLTTLGMCVYYTINRLKNDNQVESIDEHNQVNITFEERQKIICNKISNSESSEEIMGLIKKWIPKGFYFTFYANGKILYDRPTTAIDKFGSNKMKLLVEALYFDKTPLSFLFETNIILEKLVKNNILYFWHDEMRIGKDEPLIPIVNENKNETKNNNQFSQSSKILFSILTNQ